MDTFDYIIIGAGSAGCVLANRLSEDPNTTVCVLEAGPTDRWHPFITLPAGFIKVFYDKRVNWAYEMESGPWTAGRRIYAPRGKTLGGSSSINGHVYNRGQAADYNQWAQLGNRGWSYADVLPYFKRLETRISETRDDTHRGNDGPLTVTDIDWQHPLCEAFIKGCESVGIPRNKDYNGGIQEGVNYAQRTIHKGRRVSSATAFLHPAMNRPNLTVLTGAHAMKILVENRRAVGVQYARTSRGMKETTVRARREVILSGGAYNSPQLLQLSGIGNPELLKQHGIDVVHALPSVGEGLKDHYAPRFTVRVKNSDTINQRVRGLALAKEVLRYAATRKGVLALSPTLVYGFWHSGETAESSDLQFTFTPASYKEGVQGQLDTNPGMTIAIWQQRPESNGHVRIRSADPFAPPLIQTNYLDHAHDRRVIVAGMKLARRIMGSEPLQPFYDHEEWPGPAIQSDADLLQKATERATTTFHPGCSCRMGPKTDPLSVVDDQLRVHGMDGLRVVDASVMPRMLSANLNAGTIMLADKVSDMMRGRAPLEAVALAG